MAPRINPGDRGNRYNQGNDNSQDSMGSLILSIGNLAFTVISAMTGHPTHVCDSTTDQTDDLNERERSPSHQMSLEDYDESFYQPPEDTKTVDEQVAEIIEREKNYPPPPVVEVPPGDGPFVNKCVIQ